MRKNKAFTLIELLVVIAIIGILAILIFLALGRAQKGARDSQRKAAARDIATAEAMYYDANKSYTKKFSELIEGNNPYLGQVPPVCAFRADSEESCKSLGYTSFQSSWAAALKSTNGFTITAELENGGSFVCDKNGCEQKD